MRTFCRVAELKSFSATARQLDISPAMVSRQVSALESRLGIRLLNRSTRRVELSEAGQQYYQRCLGIIEQVDHLDSELSSLGSAPSGLLRVSAPMDFGKLFLRPAIREFLSSCPDIRMDVHFEDHQVHLIESQVDVAIRIASLQDSSLVSRRLGQACIGCYASPDYLAMHGEPAHPEQLATHQALVYSLSDAPDKWEFNIQGKQRSIRVNWKFSANNGRSLADAACKGMGIVRNPEFLVQDYLADGSLLEILKPYRSEPIDISAVYLYRQFKPAKISAFVDFLADYFARNGDLLHSSP